MKKPMIDRGNRKFIKALLCHIFLFFFSWSVLYAEDAYTPPVSVSFDSLNTTGDYLSSPVSVSFGSSNTTGDYLSSPVSVSFDSSNTTGDYLSSPVSVILNSLRGLWHMDDNWQDSSGNGNHGIPPVNAAFDLNGKSNSAGSFNGSGAYVDVGSSATLRPAFAVSMETWIKINSLTGSMFIAGNTDETTMTGYGLVIDSAGIIQMKIGDGSWHIVSSTTALKPGLWYHIAGTYDGNILRLYINGALDNESPFSGVINYKNPFRIAYTPGTSGAGYFSGLMDELAVYSRPLSADEILSHYKLGKIDIIPPAAPSVNPVISPTATALLSLSGTKEADTSIWVNNVKLTELDSLTTWQGTYNLQYGINTLNVTAVDAADNQSLPTIRSVILDNMPPVIESSMPANNSDTSKPVSSITINLFDTYSAIDLAASVINANVKNASGQSIAGAWTTSGTNTVIFTPANPLPQNTYTITIYQVDILGNRGTGQIVFKNYDITPPVTTITLSGTLGSDGWYSTPVTVTLTATDGADGSGVDKTEYSLDGTTWIQYLSPFILNKDGIATVSYRSVDKAGNIETVKSSNVKINQSGIVGLWHMDNNWLDSSVMGNNGTPYGGAAFSSTSKVGTYSGSFGGVNDYISINDSNFPLGASSRTIESWIKWDGTLDNGRRMILGYGSNANGQAYGYRLYSTVLQFVGYNNGDQTTIINNSSLVNTWTHLASTYDGTYVKTYINGSLVATQQLYLNTAKSNGFRIGWGYDNSNAKFSGLIDEVIIYNRALSLDEIKTHYDAASVVPPTVDPVTSPTALPVINLSGTKSANTAIVVNGTQLVALDSSTTWQGTYTLQSGLNTLYVMAMDSHGYQSVAVIVTVALDNTAPVISSSTPLNNSSVNTVISSVTINLTDSYSAIDLTSTINGAMVKNSSGQDIPGTWTTSGNSSVIFTPSSPIATEGSCTVTVYPTDSFGNRTTAQISFSYDSLAPPAPTINAVVTPTNIAAQVISGTKSSDTSSIVITTSPAATVGAVSYPTSTTWSVIVSSLKEGTNTITAYAKDSAGNQSAGVSVTIVYDSIPPSTPTINAVSSPTKDASVTLTGTKEAGSYLYVNYLKTSVPYQDVTWSYTVSLSAEGNNSILIYAKDEAGNQSASANVSVTRDTTPPRISSSTPSVNAYTNQAGSIDILLSDDYSAVDLSASLAGAVVKNSSGVLIGGTWSIQNGHIIFTPSSALTDSVYSVTLYPVDSLGNTGTVSFSFTIDVTPPQMQSLTMNPTSPHKAEMVTFIFTFNEDMASGTASTVTFGINSPYNTYTLSGSWTNARTWQASYTFTNATGDGTYTVKVSGAKDKAGNVMAPSEAGTFILDTGTPSKPTINPVTSPTKTSTITLSGTKPANTSITVNNTQKVTLDSLTTWSCTYTLLEGANTFSVKAVNAAGSESLPETISVVLDTTAPRLSSSSPANGSSSSSVLRVDILLADDNSSVDLNNSLTGATVKLGGQTVAGAWSIENSHLIFTPGAQLTEGVYTVTLYPVDILGNKGTATISFTVDITSPSVQSLAMNPTSPHKAEQVTFAVTFNEDMTTTNQPTVTFSRGSAYPTYSITGSWSNARTWSGAYTFTSGTGDGTYTVSVSGAKDKAGNTMNPQDAGAFVLDTIPPQSPTINTVTTPTKVPNQTISGTKPADTAIIINGIERVALNTSTSWSYTYPLAEGSNNISVTARDAAGNDSAPATTSITLDTTPPSFVINTYKTPSPTPTQTLTGTKEPGCIVKLNNATIFDSTDMNSTWSYTLTLMQGITNHFVFAAADALGNTITKTVDILYDVSAPAALGPGILVADGSGKGTEITLSWLAYIEASDIAYYRIYMSTSNFGDTTGMTPIATTNKGVKTYKVTGLTKGSTYYFGVVPVDSSGNFDPAVNTATGIPTDTVPPEEVTITSVTASYGSISGNSITLKWNPSVDSSGDLADQIVYFDDGKGYDAGTPLGKVATLYTKTGLNDATKYKFKITVKDAAGHESSGVIAEGVTRLPNPTGLAANPGNAKVALSWGAVSSAYVKQYNIYRLISDTTQNNAGTMLLIKTVTPSTVTYTDTGLSNGTTYQYAITTVNTYGAERTDVSSISAKPRMDETGPVISGFNIVSGQVISSPITIIASATDSESAMGRLELYIDGILVKTQTGASISYFWNVVETTDGNHTVKLIAYDQYGNLTEETRQVVVSLAPPVTPAITGHTIVQTSPEYLVNISGNAQISTTVILKVNGVVVSQTLSPTTSSGQFSFSSVKLIEGENLLSVKASHRGGESPYSPNYKITVDTGAPPAPQNLTPQILPGGVIRFTWQNAAGETPSGYNLYMSSSAFTSKASPGVTKVNISAITYLLNEYSPSNDSLRYYAVTAIDSAGNESGISNVVAASSDKAAPSITAIEYRYYDISGVETYPATIAGPGSVKVKITISETLKELPFLSLEPSEGSPIIISLTKVDDTHYEGSFNVTASIKTGPTTYKFSGKDMTGNRGSSQGAGIIIDSSGPVLSIQSPLTVLQIATAPAEVKAVFDEPSVTVPSINLKSSSGMTSPVTNLVTSDNGIHWTGSIDLSGLSEGQAEFMLTMAKDKLGNIGTTVLSGKTILLYKDSIPPPDVPTGLAAKTGKGGVITLTWNTMTGITYNIYRRAENEATPAKIMTGVLGSPAQDIPPADGTYYYLITSIGLLGSESQMSAEVSGISDRTGPPAPANLFLSLDGNGVTAAWDMPAGEIPKYYTLYRSDSPITTVSGLTPVIKVAITKAVDTAPMRSKRFYAVTAADALGNEGPLSETKEITYPVSPVNNLYLERLDNAAPAITWQPPADGNIIGYHIYRNGQRITSYPVTSLSYTDGYYSGGTVKYGISALNDLGNEGPVKEVTLPDIAVGIKQGTVLRRGLLETVPVIITSGINLTVDTIEIKVGTSSSSILQGPFTLQANSTLQLEKIASTTADAPSVVAVLTSAIWSPSPGVTVKITKTSEADVIGSSTAMEIFSEPLVKGTDGKVRIKVNNLGTALMELLTSENGGVTRKLRITLKDEDGNLLSTGYLDQRVGPSILNTGYYAVARLNPNENILTESITLNVPTGAPYKVIIEATIENTYYHYGKPDQVTAPGMTQSIETTISETAYRASASPENTFYPYAQPVLITGQAISNTSNQPMPYVPVKLGISIKGFDRFFTVTTDANGNFTYTFTPGANEAGLYTLWAVHPDIKDRAVQATFAIAGLSITPSYANIRMARGRSLDIPVSLYNYGGGSLTGLTFDTQTGSGITAGVINSGDNILTPGENQPLTLRITSSTSTPDTSWAAMTALVNEGLQRRLDATITMVTLIPVITTSPSLIDTGMVRGNQKIATFTITNVGEETLRNARIEGPSTSWMTLTNNRAIGDLKPGTSTSIGIMFNSPDTLAQGVYDDSVVIYSDNHIPYTYHMQVTVTSNAVGNVLFDVLNELMEDVPNATITLQHQTLTELIYSLRTAADGTVMLYDIPEGRYSFNISATGHKSYSGTFVISPGITTTVPVALEVTLVQVEWSVTPIVIQDRYEIIITQTFVTNVPTPVLVIEPASITVPELAPGQVFNGEFTVSNYGLIALNDVNIQFPTSFGEYDIELLSTLPKTLNAMQKVTVPYKIKRRMQLAGYQPSALSSQYACNFSLPTSDFSLIDEVKGYGGNPCYNSFTITVSGTAIICPNTAQATTVKKTAGYTVIVPIPGSDCSPSTGSVPVGGGGGVVGGSYGGGGGTQTGGGLWLPGAPPIVIGGATTQCGDTDLPRCTGDDCCDVCTQSVVKMGSGTYEDGQTDIEVKTNGIPISFERYYTSRWTEIGKPPKESNSGIIDYFYVGSSGSSTGGTGGSGGQVVESIKVVYDSGIKEGTEPQPQAYGWTSPWFARIEGSTYFDGTGQAIYFIKQTDGSYIPTTGAERYVAGKGLKIITTPTGLQVREKSGLRKNFELKAGTSASFRLASIEDERGNKAILNYDASGRLVTISDATGTPALTFTYAGNFITRIEDRDGRAVNYTVDSQGRLIEVNGPVGNKSTYEYDNLLDKKENKNYFRLLKKTDPENHITNIEYKSGELVVSKVTEPGGGTRSFTYDFPGRTFYYTDTRGITTTYTLNNDSKITSITKGGKQIKKIDYLDNRIEKVTDESGNTIEIQKNELYDPIKITDGEGNITRIEYNQYWKPSKITDPLGGITTFTYGPKQELITITHPDGSSINLEYDNLGNVTKATRGQGTETSITRYEYDTRGNLTKAIDPMGNITTYAYDQYGHLNKMTDANGNATNITNDIIGRPLTVADSLNNTKAITYDKNGNATTITDEKGRITTLTYDFKGRVTSQKDPKGTITLYTYDGEGNLTQTKEASGTGNERITQLGYDTLNRLLSLKDPMLNTTAYDYIGSTGCSTCGGSASTPSKITDPLGNITQMMFDKNGRVVGVTDRNGNKTSYAYDPLGRLIRKIYPDNKTETYTYDALGKMLTASNSNTTLTFAYDTLGRVKTYTDGRLNKTTTYEYDKNNNRAKMIDSEGVETTYSYNTIGLLTGLSTLNSQLITRNFTFTYDALGRRTGLAYPNSITATSAYDSTSNITELINKLSTAEIAKNAYTYDAVGNRLTNTDTAGTHSYEYDSTYQLIKATHPNLTEAFAYDKNGNRKAETRNQETINYTHTASNRIATRDGETYAHDKNGNIIGITDSAGTTTYEYDYENRLIKATMPNGTIAEYKYDPLGRRIEKSVTANNATTITRYLYDGDNILAEYDENNNLKTKYTHNLLIDDPLAMERNNKTYFYHKDALGSITSITDETGQVVQEYQYDSFGNITYIKDSAFIQPYTFTGREYDPETGLYFYRERTFNSKLGIFHQEDPIGFASGDVNLFRYVGNSPQMWIDPYGLFGLQEISDFSAGFGDTISFGLTKKIRQMGGFDDVVNKCAGWYKGGKWTGVGWSVAFGGVHLGRNAIAQSSLGRLFSDPRTWGSVRRTWSNAMGGLAGKGQSLHHWLIPQRFAEVNAGFNYLPISAGFNSWMNGSTAVRTAVEWGFRGTIAGIYGAPITAGLSGDECDCK